MFKYFSVDDDEVENYDLGCLGIDKRDNIFVVSYETRWKFDILKQRLPFFGDNGNNFDVFTFYSDSVGKCTTAKQVT